MMAMYLAGIALLLLYILFAGSPEKNGAARLGDPFEETGERDPVNLLAGPGSSLLEDEGLNRITYLTPDEREERERFSRPFIQPLEVTLTDLDRRDDLTRPIGEEDQQRSLSLLELDKRDDLGRPTSFNLLKAEEEEEKGSAW